MLANNADLLALKKTLPKSEAPQRTYNDVVEHGTYTTLRHGIKKSVYVEKVKKDQVVLKRDKDAVDSFTESRARFDQYYTLVTPRP